ncbi:MAG: Rieske 2Fe-2S domain-containing protein [Candidatus Freyarchaeum deiterrae]
MALVEVDKAENLQWVEFDKVTNVPLGTMKMVKIKDIPITVANVDGKFYAFNDRCPHTNAALHKGFLRGKVVICPLHYASFDVTTGKKLGDPVFKFPREMASKLSIALLQMFEEEGREIETYNLMTIEVKVEEGIIFVKI